MRQERARKSPTATEADACPPCSGTRLPKADQRLRNARLRQQRLQRRHRVECLGIAIADRERGEQPFDADRTGLSDGSLPAIQCGCAFTQALVTMATPANAGAASMLFVVPCNPSLPGVQLEAQWALFGGTASPCSAVPGLTGSNRLL